MDVVRLVMGLATTNPSPTVTKGLCKHSALWLTLAQAMAWCVEIP